MNRLRNLLLFCLLIFSIWALSACQNSPSSPPDPPAPSAQTPSLPSAAEASIGRSPSHESTSTSSSTGRRPNTPKVLKPAADGTATYGNDAVSIDASHLSEGYVMVNYTGSNPKVKMLITDPSDVVYTYCLKTGGSGYEVFPFTGGNGRYSLGIYENIYDTKYSPAFTCQLDVTLDDEFTPFLYPNQYVDFTEDSKTVEKAEELAETADDDLDVVTNVYHFVTDTISYDEKKAGSTSSDYLPVVDETLESKKGICFDYAALMTAMLRSRGIPTKLEIGYAGKVYHAWISTYISEVGWVDNIIQFDGKSWSMMDPTFAANSEGNKKILEYIGDGNNYTVKFSY